MDGQREPWERITLLPLLSSEASLQSNVAAGAEPGAVGSGTGTASSKVAGGQRLLYALGYPASP